MKQIETTAVIGAGTMGMGIVQVFAQAGFAVVWYDIHLSALEKGMENIRQKLQMLVSKGKLDTDAQNAILHRITIVSSIDQVKADLVVEAAVERIEVKRDLFSSLELNNSPQSILVTNTSSLSITAIASELSHPGRIAGLHFFNPAPLMKLVEVVAGAQTTSETMHELVAFCSRIQKEAVVCRDSPGFIVNRVARPFYVESLKILEENTSSVASVDRLMESAGFRMGPFRLMDTIGQDINFSVTKSLFEAFHFEPRFRPSRIQEEKVKSGQLGRKSGKGFYDYAEDKG